MSTTAWAAFVRTRKGWRLLHYTVRRTRLMARAAALGERQGGERTRMSDEINHGVRYKLAPVQISALPYQSPADKRRARLDAAQGHAQLPQAGGAAPAS